MVATYASHTVDYHDGITEPRSYTEAIKSPQANEWKKAMLVELDALYKQEVFEEIDHLPDPKNKKAIGSHWGKFLESSKIQKEKSFDTRHTL